MKMKFFFCEDGMREMWNKYGVYFSEKFCNYFSDKVEEILYREAGLKPSYKVSLSVFRPQHDLPMYQPGPVSRINTAISILPYYEDNVSFCWRSKTGTLVHPNDEQFDEDDLECWMEGLKPTEYFREVNTVATDHPLKLKNLPYELAVYGVGTHMALRILLTQTGTSSDILKKLSDEVERHNQKSEAKNRADGVVHNYHGSIDNDELIFRIDVGSAGVSFVRKLLRLLAKQPGVKQVVVDL